jgi:hypothetical protein
MDFMGWISPKMFGIMWNAWSLVVSSLNAKRGRLCHTRKKAFCAFNDNVNRDLDWLCGEENINEKQIN